MSASAMRNTPDRKGERLIKFVMGKAFHSFGGLVLGFSDVLRDLGGEILKNLSKNRKISVWSALRVKMEACAGLLTIGGKP